MRSTNSMMLAVAALALGASASMEIEARPTEGERKALRDRPLKQVLAEVEAQPESRQVRRARERREARGPAYRPSRGLR